MPVAAILVGVALILLNVRIGSLDTAVLPVRGPEPSRLPSHVEPETLAASVADARAAGSTARTPVPEEELHTGITDAEPKGTARADSQTVRVRLQLVSADLGRAEGSVAERTFDTRWECFDIERRPILSERRRLAAGVTIPLALPVLTEHVRFRVFDPRYEKHIAQVASEIVRADQLFELRLDERQFSLIAVDRGGAAVEGVVLGCCGDLLAVTGARGEASVPHFAVDRRGLRLTHRDFDTIVIAADEVRDYVERGEQFRAVVSGRTALSITLDVLEPIPFIVEVEWKDLAYAHFNEGVETSDDDLPDSFGWEATDLTDSSICGGTWDSVFYRPEELSIGTVEIGGNFAPHVFQKGLKVVIRDGFGHIVSSEQVLPQRGLTSVLVASTRGFSAYSGLVVSADGERLASVRVGAGQTLFPESHAALTDAGGRFAFFASTKIQSVRFTHDGYVDLVAGPDALRAEEPLVMPPGREVTISPRFGAGVERVFITVGDQRIYGRKIEGGDWLVRGVPLLGVSVHILREGVRTDFPLADGATTFVER